MDLRVTGLARAIKDKAGKYPKTGCKAEWYVIAKMVIAEWNDANVCTTKYCSISEQLQSLALSKGTEKELQKAIREAK